MAKSGTGKHTLESESPPHPQEEVTAEMAVKITELCFHCYDVDFEPMDIIMRIELAKCILNQNASFDVYGGLPFERGDATDNIVCKTVIPKREAEDSNDGSLAAPPAEAAAVSLNRGSFKVDDDWTCLDPLDAGALIELEVSDRTVAGKGQPGSIARYMQPKAEVEADPRLAAEINELYAFIRNPEFCTHARRYVCRYTAQSRKSELEERPFCPKCGVRLSLGFSQGHLNIPWIRKSIHCKDNTKYHTRLDFDQLIYHCAACDKIFLEGFSYMPPSIAGHRSLQIPAPLSFSTNSITLTKGSFKPFERIKLQALSASDQENEWWTQVKKDIMPLNRVTATSIVPAETLYELYKTGGGVRDCCGSDFYAYELQSLCKEPGHVSGYNGCPHCGCKDVVRVKTTQDNNLIVKIATRDIAGDKANWMVRIPLWRCGGCMRFFTDKLDSVEHPSLSTNWEVAEPLPFAFDHRLGSKEMSLICKRVNNKEKVLQLAKDWVGLATEEQLQLAMEGVRTSPMKCEYIRFAERAHMLGNYIPLGKTGLAELKALFAVVDGTVSDSRNQDAVTHSYASLILAAVIGAARGHEDLESIAIFCQENFEWLRENLGFKSPPSLHAFRSMFANTDMEPVFQSLISFITMQLKQGYERLGWKSEDLRHIAMDGKKSCDAEHGDMMTMGFWCAWLGNFIAQIVIDKKSSEAAGIIALFNKAYMAVKLDNAIVSCDAISCTRRLSAAVYAAGAKAVFGAKGNTGGVFDKVSDFFDDAAKSLKVAINKNFNGTSRVPLSAWAYAAEKQGNLTLPKPTRPFELIEFKHGKKTLTARRTVELSHGGVWTRTYAMSTDLDMFPEFSQINKNGERWVGLKSVVWCHSVFFSDEFGAYPRTESRIYFTGLDDISVAEKVIQGHWGIENAHLRNDRLFKDDFSKMTLDGGAANLLMIKRVAEFLLISAFPLQEKPQENLHAFVTELNESSLDDLVRKLFSFLYPGNFDPDGVASEETRAKRKTKSLKEKLSPKDWDASSAKTK